MRHDLQQLVSETIELTGASGPDLLAPGAPVLDQTTLDSTRVEAPYYVGIIGGKEVGKTALVNALVGQAISEPTDWGEGTQQVIAYAHRDQAAAVTAMLERETPGRYRLVEHDLPDLRRQVLLDLPDIDSHWTDHVALTRKMLRRLLFPIWLQSVEKYADRQVQDLLGQVAAGNDPGNFVFCLNKVDQLPNEDALVELREDFAVRVAKVLKLAAPPRVFAISAIDPARFDLPDLRQTVGRQRSTEIVRQSIQQATRQQAGSVLKWVSGQGLAEQHQRLARVRDAAGETLQARLTPLVLGGALVPAHDDAARRLEMIDASLGRRVRGWPLVNVLHAGLWPLLAFVRANVAARSASGTIAAAGGHDPTARLTEAVQGAFAQLQQSHPPLAAIYQQRRLWEPMVAEQAVHRLATSIDLDLQQDRDRVVARAGRSTLLLAPLRWLMTLGALIWFPLVQPLLNAAIPLNGWPNFNEIALLAVRVLSVEHLLDGAIFLLLWFVGLWLLLRWDTQRRVDRLTGREQPAAASQDQAIGQWFDDLLAPLDQRVERMGALVARASQLGHESEPGGRLRGSE